MAIGFPVAKADVNAAMGICAQQLFSGFSKVKQFKTWMDTQLDSDLIAMGFSQAEVNSLRSSMVDLDQLRTVFEGTGTRTPAYDYRTFAKLTIGTGLY